MPVVSERELLKGSGSIIETRFIPSRNLWFDRAINGVTKIRDNREDGDDRGGLRYRYCVIVGQHSKMEMVALLNGAIVSRNPQQSAINSIGDTILTPIHKSE